MLLDFVDHRKRRLLFVDGEGEGDQGAGGTVVEEGSQEGQESQNGSRGGQPTQHVPYERFSQVNREKQELLKQVEAYKKFGSVEQLAASIARSKELSSGTRFTATELKALEEDLKQVPALREAFDFIAAKKAEGEEIGKQFINDAGAKVSTLVKELGFNLSDPKDRQALEYDIQAVIAERIKQTPGWLARWKRNDMSVVTEAWNKVKGIYGWTRRSQNAEIQAKKLQTGRVGSDGKAPDGSKKDDGVPKLADGRIDERAVLAKAAERGFSRLKAAEE